MDNIKANLGDDDDERQDIRLLRYILSDYHANCSKPSYIVLSNERTPFAEYVIPIFKYFSASTKLLSFIWCGKGSPSNKQLMLCLSESQRKLLDGIGFSCKDKVERVMMECSGEDDGNNTEFLEEEEVTMVLKQQQSGRSPVDAKDTIKAVSRSGQAIKEL
ncbi:hypothetical protein G6F57_010156 [Rhizopus arrhizus]|nr:hypothetical protein G6F23_011237 [Rhizopus arrhizus]KAG1397601.1 hypothetical protein G6F58_011491 [Rhizopus delemar]KAG0758092.1 hypothetical protein G6F24_010046 [Rhizopus arrhizus]KAG0778881.1 hypothetical protein G6F22_010969 [Rhizopus arrhizus]KAG0784153.1 hypothetical protein G6F21_010088 [Rhizopus arrhizus]